MLNVLAVEGKFLNMTKVMYDRPTADAILNGKKWKAFPWGSGTRQG